MLTYGHIRVRFRVRVRDRVRVRVLRHDDSPQLGLRSVKAAY